jgi:cell division protein FtsZ
MVMPGLINLDFADIRTVMSEMGKAMMGTGEAEGERRAVDAAEAAISNPLLEDVSMKGARGVLINITGGLDMTLFEVDEAANRIREEVDPDANIIFGSTFDEKLQGKMRISVVATGIDAELSPKGDSRPLFTARTDTPAPSTGYTQPMLTQNAAQPRNEAVRGEAPRSEAPPAPVAEQRVEPPEPPPPVAEAAETAAVRSGAFIAPRPVDAGPPRQPTAPQPTAPQAPRAPEPPARPRGRVPSLIERVTGVGRARATPPAPPAPAREPQPRAAIPSRPAQPRLAPLEPEERPGATKEDDLLDIPAFLRRQAN